jgi:hypothetical protein
MTPSPNPKAHIASNLIRASVVFYLVYYYLTGGAASFYHALASCIAFGILLLLAFFIRQDYKWPKWVFLIVVIIDIAPDAIGLPVTFKTNIYAGLISLLIDLLQVTALALLFMPYKEERADEES